MYMPRRYAVCTHKCSTTDDGRFPDLSPQRNSRAKTFYGARNNPDGQRQMCKRTLKWVRLFIFNAQSKSFHPARARAQFKNPPEYNCGKFPNALRPVRTQTRISAVSSYCIHKLCIVSAYILYIYTYPPLEWGGKKVLWDCTSEKRTLRRTLKEYTRANALFSSHKLFAGLLDISSRSGGASRTSISFSLPHIVVVRTDHYRENANLIRSVDKYSQTPRSFCIPARLIYCASVYHISAMEIDNLFPPSPIFVFFVLSWMWNQYRTQRSRLCVRDKNTIEHERITRSREIPWCLDRVYDGPCSCVCTADECVFLFPPTTSPTLC